MNKDTIYAIITWIGIIFFFFFLFVRSSQGGINDPRANCPRGVEGNPNADFVIKYVDSPFCPYCWKEELILKRLVETKGRSFKLERYDIRYCTDIVRKYRFSGTPSFVFSTENGTKEYAHSGFIKEEAFNEIVCEMTGDC